MRIFYSIFIGLIFIFLVGCENNSSAPSDDIKFESVNFTRSAISGYEKEFLLDVIAEAEKYNVYLRLGLINLEEWQESSDLLTNDIELEWVLWGGVIDNMSANIIKEVTVKSLIPSEVPSGRYAVVATINDIDITDEDDHLQNENFIDLQNNTYVAETVLLIEKPAHPDIHFESVNLDQYSFDNASLSADDLNAQGIFNVNMTIVARNAHIEEAFQMSASMGITNDGSIDWYPLDVVSVNIDGDPEKNELFEFAVQTIEYENDNITVSLLKDVPFGLSVELHMTDQLRDALQGVEEEKQCQIKFTIDQNDTIIEEYEGEDNEYIVNVEYFPELIDLRMIDIEAFESPFEVSGTVAGQSRISSSDVNTKQYPYYYNGFAKRYTFGDKDVFRVTAHLNGYISSWKEYCRPLSSGSSVIFQDKYGSYIDFLNYYFSIIMWDKAEKVRLYNSAEGYYIIYNVRFLWGGSFNFQYDVIDTNGGDLNSCDPVQLKYGSSYLHSNGSYGIFRSTGSTFTILNANAPSSSVDHARFVSSPYIRTHVFGTSFTPLQMKLKTNISRSYDADDIDNEHYQDYKVDIMSHTILYGRKTYEAFNDEAEEHMPELPAASKKFSKKKTFYPGGIPIDVEAGVKASIKAVITAVDGEKASAKIGAGPEVALTAFATGSRSILMAEAGVGIDLKLIGIEYLTNAEMKLNYREWGDGNDPLPMETHGTYRLAGDLTLRTMDGRFYVYAKTDAGCGWFGTQSCNYDINLISWRGWKLAHKVYPSPITGKF